MPWLWTFTWTFPPAHVVSASSVTRPKKSLDVPSAGLIPPVDPPNSACSTASDTPNVFFVGQSWTHPDWDKRLSKLDYVIGAKVTEGTIALSYLQSKDEERK